MSYEQRFSIALCKDRSVTLVSLLRLSPLALALLALPLTTPAQTIPNSGQLLQQVAPPPTSTPKSKPHLAIEPNPAAAANDRTPFAVTQLQIDGNTVFDTATLHALVADGEGHTQTLTRLNTLAQRLTDYYHTHGYPLARALVPAQTLSGGIVHITVVEARYDQTRLENHSRVSDSLLRATLAPLRPGDMVRQSALDRSLALLAELPGVSPHATLSPGATEGTSTLGVVTDAAPIVQGNLLLDDAGTRYTGRMRVGGNLAINNPLHHGDQLSLSALSSGHGLRYGRMSYQYTLNGQGTRVGAAYSTLAYALGGPLRALDAHGTAQVGSAWLTQPLLRTRSSSVDLRLQFDHKRLRDRIDRIALGNDRHTHTMSASVLGQHGDDWAGGGLTSASLNVSHGALHFDQAAAADADAATARTQGSYTYWNASLARLQNLAASTRLYARVSAQHSGRNLDSSEQYLLGGPDSVRGYDIASVAGASGWLGTVELRHDLDWRCAGHCEGSVFVDHGALTVNADPWTAGRNHTRLSSAGIGFSWIGTRLWQAQVQIAVPLDATPQLTGKRNAAQLWVQVSRGF
ncbi:MAG: ShlB/FhaC/HecB family hemolysin secretion/activation protein [Rhodanobacter sp.]